MWGVGRIYSIQGGGGQKKGEGYFQNSGGELAKRGVKKFRGVWTLDEAMAERQHTVSDFKNSLIHGATIDQFQANSVKCGLTGCSGETFNSRLSKNFLLNLFNMPDNRYI